MSNFYTNKEDLNSEYISYLNGFLVKFIGDNAGLTCVAIDENEWAFSLSSVYQKVDKVCDARCCIHTVWIKYLATYKSTTIL